VLIFLGEHPVQCAAASAPSWPFAATLSARLRHARPTAASHFAREPLNRAADLFPGYASSQIFIASGFGAKWFRMSFVANIGNKLSSTSPCTPWMTRYQTGNWEMTIK
jgi:hypothetical protein